MSAAVSLAVAYLGPADVIYSGGVRMHCRGSVDRRDILGISRVARRWLVIRT